MFILGLICGAVFGTAFGMFLAALLSANSMNLKEDYDERFERED